MKKEKISDNVIRRLPRYLRHLDDMAYRGIFRISSREMSEQMGLTASQIRQDFSQFGEFGRQGYGYDVDRLRSEITDILGLSEKRAAILIGIGNLGRSLVNNFVFKDYGFTMEAAFDVSTDLVGTELKDGLTVRHTETLEAYIKEHKPEVAILAVPRREAAQMARRIAEAGVKGIWNFTNIELSFEGHDVIVENVHFSDSLLSLSYYLTGRAT